MKAAISSPNHTFEVRELPFPEIDDNDVLVENICSGISPLDFTACSESREFGRETVSRVLGFGMNVFDFNIGERVYPFPEQISSESTDGQCAAFSEYMIIPNAVRNGSLFPIPDELSDELASMVDTFAIGCHAARSAMKRRDAYELAMAIQEQTSLTGDPRYASGETALIFGADPIGIATGIALLWFGMGKVIICDNSSCRLKIAASFGLTPLALSSSEISPCFKEADAWIDFTEQDGVTDAFIRYGKKGSRFVATCQKEHGASVDLSALIRDQKTVIGSGRHQADDIEDAINIMMSNYWDLESMITHRFPIDQFDQAVKAVQDTDNSCKVMICFQ